MESVARSVTVQALLACVLSACSRSAESIVRMKAHTLFLPSADTCDDLVIFGCPGDGKRCKPGEHCPFDFMTRLIYTGRVRIHVPADSVI